MKWEAPPPASNRYIKNAYEDEAEELKAHPGEWGVIAEFKLDLERQSKDNNDGRRVANAVRQGKYVKFRPRGSFEAVSRVVSTPAGDIVKVHARYVGKD